MTTAQTAPEVDDLGAEEDLPEQPAGTAMPGADALALSSFTIPGIEQVYATALEAYYRANATFNDAGRQRRPIRKMVDLIPLGVYDGWSRAQGEPKKIPDMDKIAELLAQHGHEIPYTKSEPSLVIVPPPGFRL